jgi:hypothetical protein
MSAPLERGNVAAKDGTLGKAIEIVPLLTPDDLKRGLAA